MVRSATLPARPANFQARGEAFAALPNVAARRAALIPSTVHGPAFVRRVRDSLIRARDAWTLSGAGANLVEAEIAAGLRPEADWLTRHEESTWAASPAV